MNMAEMNTTKCNDGYKITNTTFAFHVHERKN